MGNMGTGSSGEGSAKVTDGRRRVNELCAAAIAYRDAWAVTNPSAEEHKRMQNAALELGIVSDTITSDLDGIPPLVAECRSWREAAEAGPTWHELEMDLRATRRALKLAQAGALRRLAEELSRTSSPASLHIHNKGLGGVYIAGRHRGLTARQRALSLVDFWAAKFQREA